MCGALATRRAVAVEDRAGEIEPLLDVDRVGGVLQRHAHLLGDRHEEVVEHLEHDRIGLGADRARASAAARRGSGRCRSRAVTSACQPGSTTMVWCGSMTRAGPATRAPGFEVVAQEDGGVVPGAAGIEAGLRRRRRELRRTAAASGSSIAGAAADCLRPRWPRRRSPCRSKTKPNCWRCAASKSAIISSNAAVSVERAPASGVSVPS